MSDFSSPLMLHHLSRVLKIIGKNHKQRLWCALLPLASRRRPSFICSQFQHAELINSPTSLFMIFPFFEVGSCARYNIALKRIINIKLTKTFIDIGKFPPRCIRLAVIL